MDNCNRPGISTSASSSLHATMHACKGRNGKIEEEMERNGSDLSSELGEFNSMSLAIDDLVFRISGLLGSI